MHLYIYIYFVFSGIQFLLVEIYHLLLNMEHHPELYQLIGPIEQLYQLMPFVSSHHHQQQQLELGMLNGDRGLWLVPLHHHTSVAMDEHFQQQQQYQLVGPIRNQVALFDEAIDVKKSFDSQKFIEIYQIFDKKMCNIFVVNDCLCKMG